MPPPARVSLAGVLTCLVLVVTSSVEPLGEIEMPRHTPPPPNTLSPTVPAPHTYTGGPRVDERHSGNVSSVLGRRASLKCRVVDRGNYTVSWIRHRDLHLLTVEQYTYTSDQRFKAMYEPSTGDWVLLVEWVQERDAGVYECQIGTTPPRSHFVTLHVVEPRTEILGGGDLHINTGSTINLTCLVLYHARSPDALSWLHEGKEIHYDSARGGVSVVMEAGEVTRSALLIQRATQTDSGNYTCQPRGADPATARVHVLHGEHRAAMQGGVGGGGFPADTRLVTWATLSCFWWEWVGREARLADLIWRPPSPPPQPLVLLLASLLLPHVLVLVIPFLPLPQPHPLPS